MCLIRASPPSLATTCTSGVWWSISGLTPIARASQDINTVVAHSNLNAQGYGHVWGTYRLDVDAVDGYWEGTWTGEIDEDGIAGQMLGRGYGDLEGLQIRGTMVNMAVEGVIIETPRP